MEIIIDTLTGTPLTHFYCFIIGAIAGACAYEKVRK